MFAQLPQIYKNWSISSVSGLSIYFLVEWCLGDLANLLGALFTHQASWQVAIGSYYVFVDICLVSQWFWYEKLRHGLIVRRVRRQQRRHDDWPRDGTQDVLTEAVVPYSPYESDRGSSNPVGAENRPKQVTQAQSIFRPPGFAKKSNVADEKSSSSLTVTPNGTAIHRVGPSSPIPSPSPRTILLIACLAAMVQASPMTKSLQPPPAGLVGEKPTTLEATGTILSWMSTILYLGSRLPQLIKNYRRKSTAGLSPLLFAAAFCGNLFYSLALLTNPRAWQDFGPYGGGGWVDGDGSDRKHWVLAALPFFLGAGGVLGLDASMGLQFMLYGEGNDQVVMVEEGKGRRWRWRRVSGWMRGWIPSTSEGKGAEGEALLEHNNQHGERYGAL